MVGKNILIVDDEAPIREMIAVALEMAGYECLEAENTQQAHAIIVDRKPDLILLDWMLPGTSGIELARRLKRDELTGDIPIIMLTAKGEEDNKIQGLEVGADDYITKPFSPRELVARLKAVLRRAGAGDSVEFNEAFARDPAAELARVAARPPHHVAVPAAAVHAAERPGDIAGRGLERVPAHQHVAERDDQDVAAHCGSCRLGFRCGSAAAGD